MFLTLREPQITRRISPLRQYHQLQRELDGLLVPAMYVLQHLSEPEVVEDRKQQLKAKNKKHAVAEKSQKDVFEVKLDVRQFAPEDLSVKMIDNFVVVEGKHEEKEDEFGYISRQFTRRYAIPEDVRAEEISCNLSSDGFLVFSAPRIVEQPKPNERILTIKLTGQPAEASTKKSSETSEEATTEKKSVESDKVDKDVREMNEEPIAA